MKFRAIEVDDFAPFGGAKFAFSEVLGKPPDLAEVHLFTGVNGTGKTRLLTVLAALLGNSKPLEERLRANQKAVRILAAGSVVRSERGQQFACVQRATEHGFEYLGGDSIPTAENPAFAYKGGAYVTDLPLQPLPSVPKPAREACLAFVRPGAESKALLEAIVNVYFKAAVESMDAAKSSRSASVLRDAPATAPHDAPLQGRAARMVDAIESTISSITGRAFYFKVSAQPIVRVRVQWGPTEVPFALLPDGLRSIIGWMVHAVVMMDAFLEGQADPLQSEAIFLLDEVESHLHPAWQRRILPAFQRLFPKAQIFVATHSPFVIASLNHGWIHPLKLEAGGRVLVPEPVPASEGDSYVTVLEEIMDLTEWYDPETEALLTEFRARRDIAYRGDAKAQEDARGLAAQIGRRSPELGYMMGRELSQMDRQLASPVQRP